MLQHCSIAEPMSVCNQDVHYYCCHLPPSGLDGPSSWAHCHCTVWGSGTLVLWNHVEFWCSGVMWAFEQAAVNSDQALPHQAGGICSPSWTPVTGRSELTDWLTLETPPAHTAHTGTRRSELTPIGNTTCSPNHLLLVTSSDGLQVL